MSGEVRGALEGTLESQAARLAGMLAEAGVGAVEVEEGSGARRVLRSRETDLPGEVRRLAGRGGGGVIRAEGLGVEFEVGARGVRWRARDRAAVMRLGLRADDERSGGEGDR